MSFKDFAKEATFIGLAQVLTGIANFLLLPLVTKALGAYDYGRWIQISVTIMLLSQIVLLQLQTALIRFLSSKTDKKEIGQEFFTLFSFIALAGFGVAAIVLLVVSQARTLGIIQETETIIPLMVAAFIIPFYAFGALTTAYFMAVRRFKTFAALTVLSSMGQLFLTLILISMGFGLIGVVIAALVMSIVMFSIAIVLVSSEIGLSLPRFHLLRPNLKFSLPLTPGSLLSWVTDSSDRYLVAFILGVSMAGIYSAAYGIAAVVFLLINPIQIVLYPTISRLFDNNEHAEVRSYLSKSLRYFLMIAIPAVAGMTVLAEPLLIALTTPDFAQGAPVIPLVALAGLFSGALSIVTIILLLVRKTHLNLITFAISATANVILVLILTPILGLVGAALATTIAYAMMLLIGSLLSFRHIRFSADWGFIAKSVTSASFMVISIVLLNPATLYEILMAISIGIPIYFISLFFLRGINYAEIEVAKAAVTMILKKVRRKGAESYLEEEEGPLSR